MARGEEAKLRRRNRRKNEAENVTDMFGDVKPENDDASTDDEKDEDEATERVVRKVKPKEIKRTPLILLVLLTGTTLLPALIYLSDMMGEVIQKNNLVGNLGYRLGIGAVPKKRVLSFYEKHAPEKLEDVPNILAKHYGDYSLLVKKLERKYGDYGYFLGWEEDEAPLTLALEQLQETRDMFVHQYWNRYAPQALKTAFRNIQYNLGNIYKMSRKIFKKQIWPALEPFLGVPKGAEKQKRKDAREAKERKAKTGGSSSSSGTRSKKRDFRDDVED